MSEVSKVNASALVESMRTQIEATAKVAEVRSAEIKARITTPMPRDAVRLEPLPPPQNLTAPSSAEDNAPEDSDVTTSQELPRVVQRDAAQVDPQVQRAAQKAISEANRILAERLTGADSRLVIESDPYDNGFIYKSVDKNGTVKAEWPRSDFLRIIQHMADVNAGAFVDKRL